jgi:tryptophan 2,3-dioxygenase
MTTMWLGSSTLSTKAEPVHTRVIGHQMGAGGSFGGSFLRKALAPTILPELWDVRAELEWSQTQ